MPPAIVAAVVSIGAAVAAAVVKSAIVAALITIAASIVTTIIAKKANKNKLNQGQELRTKIDPGVPREVLVGETATGGSVHFVYTTTNSSKKPNRYLYRVVQLSDRPCDGLISVTDGNRVITFNGDVTTGWRASNDYRSKKGAACMWMRVHLGSDNPVADATLVSETGGVWTNAHKGKGLCYAILKMDYDADAFPNGEPALVWVLRGAKLYDDRKDSTVVGGSGAHRLNNYETWEYSDTCSLITAQFLRGFYTGSVRIVGVGAESRDLARTMLFSAHNTCEQSVTVEAGTEKRYAAALNIKADESADSILEDLQMAMDGAIYDRGGAITMLPGANRTPVLNITPDDIDWTAEKFWQPEASLEVMLNCVLANFIDKDSFFQEADLPVQKNAAWELADGGERFTSFFSFRAMNKRSQGQRITKRIHLASRYSGTCAFVGGIWLLELEQGDWFTMDNPRWGFSGKYFEVREITITSDLRIAIVAREVDPNNDAWNHVVDEKPRSDTTWNPPAYNLPVPVIYTSTYKMEDDATGRQSFAVEAGLTAPDDYGGIVKRVEVQYKPIDAVDPINAGSFAVDQKKLAVSGLIPDTQYQVRARTTDGARFSDWTAWTTATTPGTVPPTIRDTNLPDEAIPVGTLGITTGDNQTYLYDGMEAVDEGGPLMFGTEPLLFAPWVSTQDYALPEASFQVDIKPPADQFIYCDQFGVQLPEQFPPRVLTPVVMLGTEDIRTRADVTYELEPDSNINVVATVNNQFGSPDKGRITITAGQPGFLLLRVKIGERVYGPYKILFTRVVAAASSPGGSGSKQAEDPTIETVYSTADVRIAGPLTVTVAAGEDVTCTAPLTYSLNSTTTSASALRCRWRKSPAGANTYTDAGPATTGALSYWYQQQFEGEVGSGDFSAVVTGLTPGDWDFELVGAMTVDPANGSIETFSGTARVVVS